MKKAFSCGLMLMLAAHRMWATALFYQNDGIVNCPPQIPPQVDATNFLQNGLFIINFTNFLTINPELYRTANTLNFTNTGAMIGNVGFQFDTGPVGSGQRRMANNFDNRGTISAGSLSNTNVNNGTAFLTVALPQIVVSATNITMNSGTNLVGANGMVSLSGQNLDLTRGNILMEGFDVNAAPSTIGVFNAEWGIGVNRNINPAGQFGSATPTTPPYTVTTPAGVFAKQLSFPTFTSYVDAYQNSTNVFIRAVFIRNTNAAVDIKVYAPPGFYSDIYLEWGAKFTNLISGALSTNYLYLIDQYIPTRANGLIPTTSYYSGQPTFIPTNFLMFQTGTTPYGLDQPPFSLTPLVPGSPSPYMSDALVTNEFAAYRGQLSPTTVLPTDLPPNSQLKDIPGRVHIGAAGSLDLTRARIIGPNYLGLFGTNHFVGSSRAQISVPYLDISLRSTNGSLLITNVLLPTVPRLSGYADAWAGRWTNNSGIGLQYHVHVLMVDSHIEGFAVPTIQDLTLRSTNLAGGSDSMVISDVLNVTRTLSLESQRITISSNAPGSSTGSGQVNLKNIDITWPGSTPRLQYLTNAGIITAANAVFFGGSRTSPFYSSNFNEPYIAFVNRGLVSTEGNLIWANYFENNGGIFNSGGNFGSLTLESQKTRLTNGALNALTGNLSITTGELISTNCSLQTGRRLTLSATSLLTDTGARDANTWITGNGFSLIAQPNNGDLLGTTIFDNLPAGAESIHYWAGQDRGCSIAGFANNAALGRLVLDGGVDTSFRFAPVGVNALYVDCIEFRDRTTTTIIDGEGNVEGVTIDPNMKIYYAQALATDGSVAERINGANGGRFCWVSAYTGFYSSTNLIYGDGTTNTFNAALVQSCNIDSDGDGIVNCVDPEPILRALALNLQATFTNAPKKGVVASWQSLPGSTNKVFFSPNGKDNWQPLTNFVNPNWLGGRVSVFDPLGAASTRYYRVQVDPQQP